MACAPGRTVLRAALWRWLIPVGVGALGMVLIVTPSVTDGRLPGDLIDGRLNNYFLEHLYRWLSGQTSTFWTAPMFYPYRLTMAFSDTHFGDGLAYVGARLAGLDREDAYALWFATGYALNFAASAYALSRLGYTPLATALGAFLFAFGLPMTVQEGHAQLLYRFGVPLAVLALIEAGERGSLRRLAMAAAWTVWQFYCSIYTGYFLLLLLGALILAQALCADAGPLAGIRSLPASAWRTWQAQPRREKAAFLGVAAGLAVFMAMLLVPYAQASRLYHLRRGWAEISSMLPRPVSYLSTLNSEVWPTSGALFDALPMRWEHAMFVGIGPILPIAIAVVLRLTGRTSLDARFAPSLIAILLLVILTLHVQRFSLYLPLAMLPGSNAIRVVTRIGIVMLMPLALAMASAVDGVKAARIAGWARGGIAGLVAVVLVAEASFIRHGVTTKSEWRSRMASVAALLPAALPDSPILLLAPTEGINVDGRQVDAMMFAQERGWPTINGYSGNLPPGYIQPVTCRDGFEDLAAGLAFFGNPASLPTEARRVVAVGFGACPEGALRR